MTFLQNLRREIPRWTKEGLLSDSQADRILAFYQSERPSLAPQTTTALARILGIIGTSLIGLGIILIFAYNWSDIPKPAKLLLAFAPLAASLCLAAFTLARKETSTPWRESVGVALALSAAACLGLVAQTLQLQSSLAAFYFTWQLSCLPLLFALRARSLFVLLCLLSICWAVSTSPYHADWLAVRFAIPSSALLIYFLWENREAPSRLSSFAFTVSTIWTVTAVTWAAAAPISPLASLALIAATFYVWLPQLRAPQPDAPLFTPAEAGSKLTLTVAAFALTYRGVWDEYSHRERGLEWGLYLIVALVAACYLWGFWKRVRRSTWHEWPWQLLPIGIAALSSLPDFLASSAMIAYVGWMVVAAIHHGYASSSIARLNHGLLLMLALAVTRFFDDDFNMLTRGGTFVVVGVIFLAANLHFLKRRNQDRHES